MSDDRFNKCAECDHYRGEHNRVTGSCLCDVLVWGRWKVCYCPDFFAEKLGGLEVAS